METSLILYWPLSWAFNNPYLSFGLIASFFLFRIALTAQNNISKIGDLLIIVASFIYIFFYRSLPIDDTRFNELKTINCISEFRDLSQLVSNLPLKNDNNTTFKNWADIKLEESRCLQENKKKKDI